MAMREAGVTTWLLSDHLGSTSVAYRASDGQATSQRYYAWGTIRPGPENELPTDYTFTGQMLDESSALLYYVARWYDRLVGRFLSPDSIVPAPGNPQSLNRFAYAGNNPLRYSDPSGHMCDPGGAYGGLDPTPPKPPVPEDPIPQPDIPDDPIPIPEWPATGAPPKEVRERAEAAFRHFLSDPAYFVALWMNPSEWNAVDETMYLRIFANHSELHWSVERLILTSTIRLPVEDAEAIAAAPWRNAFNQQLPEYARGAENASITLVALGVDPTALARGIAEWLGPGTRVYITNGNYTFVSSDNMRKFRWDIGKTFPHENPHAHVQWWENGDWAGERIYPVGVDRK